jgi:hypothetical protein
VVVDVLAQTGMVRLVEKGQIDLGEIGDFNVESAVAAGA